MFQVTVWRDRLPKAACREVPAENRPSRRERRHDRGRRPGTHARALPQPRRPAAGRRPRLARPARRLGCVGLPRPTAILVVSAHWEEAPLALGATETVPLVYDFWGFPEHYTACATPPRARPRSPSPSASCCAPGTPVQDVPDPRPRPRGLRPARRDVPRGRHAGPPGLDADPGPGPADGHGRKLAPLRDEGVLIVGSGFFTHNLAALRQAGTRAWSAEFNDWGRRRWTPGTSTPCSISATRPRRAASPTPAPSASPRSSSRWARRTRPVSWTPSWSVIDGLRAGAWRSGRCVRPGGTAAEGRRPARRRCPARFAGQAANQCRPNLRLNSAGVPTYRNPKRSGSRSDASWAARCPRRPGARPPPGAGTFPSRTRRSPPGRRVRLTPSSGRAQAWGAGHPEPEPRGGPPDGRLCHRGIDCRW
ncbi:hypothetical protein SFUMM280S_10830 [Streptomyces fumanus]